MISKRVGSYLAASLMFLLSSTTVSAFWPLDGLFGGGEVLGESTETEGITYTEEITDSTSSGFAKGRLVPFTVAQYNSGVKGVVNSTVTLNSTYNAGVKMLKTGKNALGKKLSDKKLAEIHDKNQQRLIKMYSDQMTIEGWLVRLRSNVVTRFQPGEWAVSTTAGSDGVSMETAYRTEIDKLNKDVADARAKVAEAEDKLVKYLTSVSGKNGSQLPIKVSPTPKNRKTVK